MSPENPRTPDPSENVEASFVPADTEQSTTVPEKRIVSEIPFTSGQEVTVQRSGVNGGPPTLEAGWTVTGFNEETNKYDVSRYDEENGVLFEKSFTGAKLTSFQPDLPQTPPLETKVDSKEFAPPPEFPVGDVVSVRRRGVDAQGNRAPENDRVEAGWRVISRDEEAGTVDVESPDGVRSKTYAIDALRKFQPAPEAAPKPEMITVPDFAVEAARSTIDWEPRPEPHVVEELAELATEQMVADPSEQTPETHEEMLDRFVRESRAELSQLYADLRAEESKPASQRNKSEIDSLNNQIKNAKEDLGRHSKNAALAKGQNWI